MNKSTILITLFFLFSIAGKGQSDKPRDSTLNDWKPVVCFDSIVRNQSNIMDSNPMVMNGSTYSWGILRNEYKAQGISYFIFDSSGIVAKQDSSGRWEIIDAERALTIMVDNFIRETARLENELELSDNIINQLKTDGTIKNWKLYRKAVKEYQDYHSIKQPLKIYSR